MTPEHRTQLSARIRELRAAGFDLAAMTLITDEGAETRDFTGTVLRRESRADFEAREAANRFSVREA